MSGTVSLPVCGSASCFPGHVLVVCSRAGVYRLVCNHLNVAAWVLWDVCLCCLLLCHFFNCHCGKTGMCHCLLLAAGVRKPNYHGSQCLVCSCSCGCACVCVECVWGCSGEQLSQAPLAVMAGDSYGCSSDSKEEEEADRLIRDSLCVVCCHLGPAQ